MPYGTETMLRGADPVHWLQENAYIPEYGPVEDYERYSRRILWYIGEFTALDESQRCLINVKDV